MLRQRFVFAVAVAAGLVLLAGASARAGDGQTEVVVASGSTAGCTGFFVESLSGTVSRCLAFASGAYPGDYQPDGAAADGSVVFEESYLLGSGTTNGALTELVHPSGNAVALDMPPGYDADLVASISANGSRITFLRDTGAGDIYVVNSDGSGLTLVASVEGAYLSAPAISPKGDSIAYWCVTPTRNDPAYAGPRKCGPLPDGSYRPSGLMLMNANGTDKRMIVVGPGEQSLNAWPPGDLPPFSLSWSPNGQWLTGDELAPNRTEQVFAYRTDGSDLFNYLNPSRQVTHDKNDVGFFPQFCNSSSRILYESGSHAYLINRNGTHRHRTAIALQASYPACVAPPGGGSPRPTMNAMRITVPAVCTLSYTATKRRLQRAGLHVGAVRYAFSSRVPRGHVIAQYPGAGTHLHRVTRHGPPVKLVVSRGPRP